MKKTFTLVAVLVFVVLCAVLVAQQAPPPGGRAGGMRGPQVPPASGPMLDIANKMVEAVNKQDVETLHKMLASDAVYLDEDGHAPMAQAWINKLATGTPPKQLVISSTHSQMWDDAGWVSFNYELTEQFQGQPKTVKGTASIVVKKPAGGDWQIALVHGALYQRVAGITQ
jgi:ketosteroid isomerase-like protein